MTATILFADNNSTFLQIRKEFLLRAGYNVLSATNYIEAEKYLRNRKDLDLAILDMRLEDDDDETDRSGIFLAKNSNKSIPKIILTGFPTWQAAREALARDLDGIAPAVEIIDKKEDPDRLVRAVYWILNHSELRKNIVGAFDVPSMVAVPDRIISLGIEEAGRRLHNSFSETSRQWAEIRKHDQTRAVLFHKVGLAACVIAVMFIFAGLGLMFAGMLKDSALPILVGAVIQPISIFFFMREDAVHKRIRTYDVKLDENKKVENLLLICDSLVDKEESERLKRKIVENLLDHWLQS